MRSCRTEFEQEYDQEQEQDSRDTRGAYTVRNSGNCRIICGYQPQQLLAFLELHHILFTHRAIGPL
jgi:hypothetical protein